MFSECKTTAEATTKFLESVANSVCGFMILESGDGDACLLVDDDSYGELVELLKEKCDWLHGCDCYDNRTVLYACNESVTITTSEEVYEQMPKWTHLKLRLWV